MRHRIARRKLNRTSEHRLALRRNMAQNLFEQGQIRTTLPKAKDLRPFVERLITLARRASSGTPATALAARQRLIQLLGDRAMIPEDHRDDYDEMSDAARTRVRQSRSGRRHRLGQARGGQQFTAVSIVHHLITNIAPRYADRPGGYTRVVRIGRSTRNDNAPMAVLQLVGQEESPGTVTRPERTARSRRTESRYAAAARAAKKQRSPSAGRDAAPKEADAGEAPADPASQE